MSNTSVSSGSSSSCTPLHVFVAMDKYKGTLTSALANDAVSRALTSSLGSSSVTVDVCATSDGGDGFVEALVEPLGLTVIHQQVRGPLGTIVTASWAHDNHGTAYVEMASASGIALVPSDKRNPLLTSTYGTGEIMYKAWHDIGCKKIVLGIGGSATNDGGLGALAALGVRVLMRAEGSSSSSATDLIEAKPEDICGASLSRVVKLDMPKEHPLYPDGAEVLVCCDVRTPFCGPTGATYTFAPQKGASTPEILSKLEEGMQNLSRAFPHSVDGMEGAGAAGGLSGGLFGVLGSKVVRLQPGFPFVADVLNLPTRASRAQLLITGEGAVDDTTADGKTVSHILNLAIQHKTPCVVLCGHAEDSAEKFVKDHGATQVLALDRRFPLDVCMKDTAQCIETIARESIVPLCKQIISSTSTQQ